jgi:prophage regulatory protein
MSLSDRSKPVQSTHGAAPAPHAGGATVTPAKPGKILRLPAVEELTGLKKSTIYSQVANGSMPSPVRLSARAVGWREEDMSRWLLERTSKGQ